MKRAFCLLICLLLIVGTAGCADPATGDNSDVSADPYSPETIAKGISNGVGTAYPDKEVGFQLEAPEVGEKIAVMHTSMGDVSIRFFPEAAPKAVQNFLTHAENGYYDGLTFHRVIEDFMIQGGDPEGTGSGGESIWGESFEDEFDQKLLNLRGSLSMANSGVNTNGSQFFINQASAESFSGKDSYKSYSDSYKEYEDLYNAYVSYYGDSFQAVYPSLQAMLDVSAIAPISDWVPAEVWALYEKNGGNIHLDGAWRVWGGHTVFGQVFDGMDVVDAIAAVEVDSDSNKPLTDVIIQSITVTTYAG